MADCILIGASVRAAACSAFRAGLTPWCVDLFGDADLSAIASIRRIPFADYPHRFPQLLNEAPPAPVIYTGGLENHPGIIERIAGQRTLWGNDAKAMRLCRDPFRTARLLREHGLPALDVAHGPSAINGSMLKKPRHGAGGSQVALAAAGDEPSRSCYYQQFMPGPSFAAVFCAFADRTDLLGVTEQLVGEAWLHAKPFQYCGSIGPVDLGEKLVNKLMQMGEVLRTGCGLRGLFGVDFILNHDRPWMVEINPRYTASVEVLEHATGLQALNLHQDCWRASRREPDVNACNDEIACNNVNASEHVGLTPRRSPGGRLVGKAILFAPKGVVFPTDGPWTTPSNPFLRPDFADIPHVGEIIEAGWPILTIFEEASTSEDCRLSLRERAAEVYSQLGC